MTIADSDVLIETMRGKEPFASIVSRRLADGLLVTTSVSTFKLWAGAKSDSEKERVRKLLAAIEVVPFDESAALQAASARRDLEALGLPIGTADYLIAGVCLSRGMSLLTNNRKHFERVPGLVLA